MTFLRDLLNKLPSKPAKLSPTLTPEKTDSFGVAGWLEKTRISLPLKGVECRFDVCGDILNVEIDQIYHQSASVPMDCDYTFPLPAGAAVYCCELRVNDRIIRARVEEAIEARRVYAEKKAEGRRVGLVEMERPNLFTLSLGNLQPGDVMVVRFAYFQTLERLDDQLSIRIPVCPGIRYIPGKPLLRILSRQGTVDDTDQVSDASRISPPRIDVLHPDAAYFFLRGSIDVATAASGSISSPSHPVVVNEHAQAGTIGVLLADGGAVPDRDFVLRWQEPKETALTPRAWSFSDGNDFALVQLRAPKIADRDDNYEQDVYFLIDRSGSMGGEKWTKTCQALHAFMDLLGERDRAWMTFFESSYQDFAEKPLPAKQLIAEPAFQKIENIGVAGGTELLPALRHVAEVMKSNSPGRRSVFLIITDGQVGNEDEVLESLREYSGVTVHVFGIDTTVNDAFLKSIARQQRGQCFLMTPEDDIRGTVAKLGERIRRPVLTDIEVNEEWELASETVPDLYSSEVAGISLRAAGASSLIRFSGRLPSGDERLYEFDCTAVRNPAIKLFWARARIEDLLAKKQTKEAIALAKQSNLLCAGTCFVAWDDAESVPVSNNHVYQPSLSPALQTMGLFSFRSAPMSAKFRTSTLLESQIRRGDWDKPDNLLSDVDMESKPARDFNVIASSYRSWPRSVSIMLGDSIESVIAEMKPLLFFEEEMTEALLALFGSWAVRNGESVESRLKLLNALLADLKAAGTNRQEMCELIIPFLLHHCCIDKKMREDVRYLVEACSKAWPQP